MQKGKKKALKRDEEVAENSNQLMKRGQLKVAERRFK